MKTLVLGVFVFGLTLPIYSLGADSANGTTSQQKMLSSENGRYIFGQVNAIRADQFMIDTKTGRMWAMRVTNIKKQDGSGDAEIQVLAPVHYVDDNNNIALEPK